MSGAEKYVEMDGEFFSSMREEFSTPRRNFPTVVSTLEDTSPTIELENFGSKNIRENQQGNFEISESMTIDERYGRYRLAIATPSSNGSGDSRESFIDTFADFDYLEGRTSETRESLLNAMSNLGIRSSRRRDRRGISVTPYSTECTANKIHSPKTPAPMYLEKTVVPAKASLRKTLLAETTEKIIVDETELNSAVHESMEIPKEENQIGNCSSKASDELSSSRITRERDKELAKKGKTLGSQPVKFVSMAESILKFQTTTPKRFRSHPTTKESFVNARTRSNTSRAGPSTKKLVEVTAVEPSSSSALVAEEKNPTRSTIAKEKHPLPKTTKESIVNVRKTSALSEKTVPARGKSSLRGSSSSLTRTRREIVPAPAVADRDDASPEPDKRSKKKNIRAETSMSRSTGSDLKERSGTHRTFEAGTQERNNSVEPRPRKNELERLECETAQDTRIRGPRKVFELSTSRNPPTRKKPTLE